MDKLNSTGITLLKYKSEYQNSSSDIVRDALATSLEVMMSQGVIDKSIKEQILSDNDGEQLKILLESNPKYRKGPRELFKEYEKIRAKVDSGLESIGFQGYFETETSVEFNRITVLRQFSLDKEFLLTYFGLQEIDLIQLMKKRGFAEKFAVLRMNLVMDEVLDEIRPEENIAQGHSLVYYNPDITGFSIDYKYQMSVDVAEDDNSRANILRKINEIDRIVDQKFRQKMGMNFYMKKKLKKEESIVEKPKNQERNEIKQQPKTVPEKKEESKTPETQQAETKTDSKSQEKPKDDFKEVDFDIYSTERLTPSDLRDI